MDDADVTFAKNISEAFEPHESSLKGLRNKVLIRILVVALIPLLILSWYFRNQFTTTLETRSNQLLATIAKGHQDAIDRIINSKITVLKSLSEDLTMPPSNEKVLWLLKILQNFDKTILDVGVFDSNGNHVRYAGPFGGLEGKNYQQEPWFQKISAPKTSIFISDVYLGYRNKPHFAIAIQIESNRSPWYIRITIDPVKFNEIVDDVKVVDSAHAFIINNNCIFQIVSHGIGKVLTAAPSCKEMSKEMGVFKSKDGLEDYLVAYSKMKSIDWTMVVRQELSAANRPIYQTTWVVILIILVGILFIVAISIYATRSLVRRYRRSERDRSKLIEQLMQAGKIATLGEMAAGVAHEINNPLAVILSEIGVIDDYLDPTLGGEFDREEFRKILISVKDEIFRCKNITHKLLGFARQHESTVAVQDMNAIVTETVELVAKELSFENIEIVLDLDANLPNVLTDAEKVKQVLLNLARNAVDSIGKNGKITLSTHRNQENIGIIISDTGCGIPEENLSKLFLPFYTTKEVGKGTGLGLSISHGLITSLGGKINVTSEVGNGTIFEVLLPYREE